MTTVSPAPTEVAEPPSPPRRRRGDIAGALALLAAAVTGAALWSVTHSPGPAAGRPFALTPAPGAPAPDFDLPALDGGRVRLADLRGRVVLLNFWATWCPPCREELPGLQAVSHALESRGLTVLAVNYLESPELVRTFARDWRVELRILLDRDGTVTRRYRLAGLPGTFVVDRQGRLVGSALGYRDWGAPGARAYLDALLAARD